MTETKACDKGLVLDGHKLLWHKDSVQAWLKGERIAPITIDCSLTRKCSYRCVYCYGQLQANDEKNMMLPRSALRLSVSSATERAHVLDISTMQLQEEKPTA